MTEYIVKKIEGNKPTFADWDLAPAMVLLNNADGKPSETPAAAKLLYNDNGMFFRFCCKDDTVNCKMTGYNEPIYDEETVELFFVCGADPKRYLELEWNGIGGVFCAYVNNDLNGHTSLDFVKENPIDSHIIYDGADWKAEGFVPREVFDGSMSGTWTFNAYRIKRRKDNSMILSAFQPTFVDYFHKPLQFATLKFSQGGIIWQYW